ncbi:hypothetical protein RsoM2USA_428 [Ralstonia phage RsoM2USA]|nr:hypothetical protein RsoM2USA_428 [Ralstonia phage RsoM2USA]
MLLHEGHRFTLDVLRNLSHELFGFNQVFHALDLFQSRHREINTQATGLNCLRQIILAQVGDEDHSAGELERGRHVINVCIPGDDPLVVGIQSCLHDVQRHRILPNRVAVIENHDLVAIGIQSLIETLSSRITLDHGVVTRILPGFIRMHVAHITNGRGSRTVQVEAFLHHLPEFLAVCLGMLVSVSVKCIHNQVRNFVGSYHIDEGARVVQVCREVEGDRVRSIVSCTKNLTMIEIVKLDVRILKIDFSKLMFEIRIIFVFFFQLFTAFCIECICLVDGCMNGFPKFFTFLREENRCIKLRSFVCRLKTCSSHGLENHVRFAETTSTSNNQRFCLVVGDHRSQRIQHFKTFSNTEHFRDGIADIFVSNFIREETVDTQLLALRVQTAVHSVFNILTGTTLDDNNTVVLCFPLIGSCVVGQGCFCHFNFSVSGFISFT